MTQEVKCDICNCFLKENEVELDKGVLGIGKKLKPRNSMNFKYDGIIKHKDFCSSCGKKVNDAIERIREDKFR